MAAEQYIGRALPQSLRSLLKQQNGGVSNYDAFERRDEYYPLLPMLGVSPDVASDTLMRSFDVRAAFDVPEGVIVFSALGYAWLGLDYRRNPDRPSVVYRNEPEDQIHDVASTFDEFLAGLTEG